MSEETKQDNPVEEQAATEVDDRIQIKAKDAAEQLLPGGKSVNEMSNEEMAQYTANMAKADRLYAKHTDGLTDLDKEVFDALLLASDPSNSVEERFKSTVSKFESIKKGKDEDKKDEEAVKEVPPKGNMETTSRATGNPINKLEPENDSPLGDDQDYFDYLLKRYRGQTTVKRNTTIN
jgi:hypothetical protein|tara:strand:- start:641 stop:1174 length:534 start_codon:yes stop_codon:yes gene_type:complete